MTNRQSSNFIAEFADALKNQVHSAWGKLIEIFVDSGLASSAYLSAS